MVRLNSARFVAYSHAVVKTGIDLQKLQPGDIKTDGKMISIELPHVQVLSFSYPSDQFRIDSSITRDAFLNDITVYDIEYYYQLAEIDIRNKLQYMGVKEATENKTRLFIEGLLRNIGYEEIYISFKEGELIKEIDEKNIL